MIIDVLENAILYQHLNDKFATAFKYLRTTNFTNVSNGNYAIEGEEIFAIVNEYFTKDKAECRLEAHRKYIDIQYIVKGTELFGYTPFTGQRPIDDYDDSRDVAFYKEEVSYLRLEAQMFIVFFPTDLHQSQVRQYEPALVKKVVVKIRI